MTLGTHAVRIVVLVAGLAIGACPAAARGDAAADYDRLAKQFHEQYRARKYADAEKTAAAMRTLAAGPLAGKPALLGSAWYSQAIAVDEQGRRADAVTLFKRSLAVREKALPADSLDTARTLHYLGVACMADNHSRNAEPYLKRALAIRQKVLGSDHADTARTVYSLGLVCLRQRRYAEAESLLKRALAVQKKTLKANSPEIAQTLYDLSLTYYRQRRSADAERLLKQSLAIREKALPPDSLDTAATLNDLGTLYNEQGRYREAEPFWSRALAIRQKVLGAEHAKTVQSMMGLAYARFRLGRFAEAEALYKRALAIREKTLGQQHPDVATGLENLAFLYCVQARFAEAEPLLKRAIAIVDKREGTPHHSLAASLNDLGSLYKEQGRYDEAEPLLLRALRIRRQTLPPDDPHIANTLRNLARLYSAQIRFKEAERLLQEALAIMEKSLPPGHPNQAEPLQSLASLYVAEGRFAEAEPLYKRASQIVTAAYGPDHYMVATILNEAAQMYRSQSRWAEAEPLLKRALAIREKSLGPEHFNTIVCINDLALLYKDQERFAEAEGHFRRAAASWEKAMGPEHSAVAVALANLADTCRSQKKYAEAEPLFKRAMAIQEKTAAAGHHLPLTLVGLATLYTDQGRWADAEPLFRRALALRQEQFGPDHPHTALTQCAFAMFYAAQGRWADAEPLADKAIAVLERTHTRPDRLLVCYHIRAMAGWQAKRRGEALADLRRAMELAEHLREQSTGMAHERAELFGHFADVFEQMVAWQAELDDPGEALATIERARARSLLDDLNLSGVNLDLGRPVNERRQLKRREQELKTQVAVAEQQVASAADDGHRIAGAKSLAEAKEALYKHFADQRSTSPVYRGLLSAGAGPLRLSRVQREMVGADGLLLMYLLGAKNGYVLAVGPDAAHVATLSVDDAAAATLGVTAGPLHAERLRAALTRDDGNGLLQQLASRQRSAGATAKLAALWKVLVPEPQRQLLAGGKLKRLIVVPDGPLALVPMETLVVRPGDNPQYLLDVGPPILYGPSATVIHNLGQRPLARQPQGRNPVLSVGDPAYPDLKLKPAPVEAANLLAQSDPGSRYATVGGQLARLPYTAYESAWVAETFRKQGWGVDQLLQKDATKANVCREAPGRRIIHLACHGMADQSYGNFFGALALAPGAKAQTDPADDGYLTLAEICELNLKDCELALLSACETNFGPQQRGEGVWALSRGFLVAGCRRVVASNWLVDDEAASSLVSYYCSIIARPSPDGRPAGYAEALRDAKRWVRRQDKWSSPFYWAPFVLVGPN